MTGPTDHAPSRRRRPSDRRATSDRRPRTVLTLDAIVTRACSILDLEGVDALTLRRLAGDLDVGVTSMYWHVDDKDELLDLCFQATLDPVVGDVLGRQFDPVNWRAGLRDMLAGLFEAMERHPWLAELAAAPQIPQSHGEAVTRIWDRIGAVLGSAGLDEERVFYASSTLAGHLGSMGLVAARSAYGADGRESREQRLTRRADELAALDPEAYPYASRSASMLRGHSERDQFLGGVDLILDGIAAQISRELSRHPR
jgi:AcrR family transcriptional regulator